MQITKSIRAMVPNNVTLMLKYCLKKHLTGLIVLAQESEREREREVSSFLLNYFIWMTVLSHVRAIKS